MRPNDLTIRISADPTQVALFTLAGGELLDMRNAQLDRLAFEHIRLDVQDWLERHGGLFGMAALQFAPGVAVLAQEEQARQAQAAREARYTYGRSPAQVLSSFSLDDVYRHMTVWERAKVARTRRHSRAWRNAQARMQAGAWNRGPKVRKLKARKLVRHRHNAA